MTTTAMQTSGITVRPEGFATPPQRWPTHKELPETDGLPVDNSLELPQHILLSSAIKPVLDARHPDGHYFLGHDVGIYFAVTDPPLQGCKAPDWFYVPGVPPTLEGEFRRSYVMWHEKRAPLLLIEFASRDGSEERDRTPDTGKFWVYEHVIRPAFYAIYQVVPGRIELYRHVEDHFEPVPANERGHYPVPPLGVELGLWEGTVMGIPALWLRFYDTEGRLLPTADERAEQEKQRAERLAARLRALGIDPEAE